mmetsp:Transcript_2715/g.3871  ORF Transcript_2715/g.3871 Transcript_2715/m.3871 type:complete len:104 (-) Transcript_2715:14-325(-)
MVLQSANVNNLAEKTETIRRSEAALVDKMALVRERLLADEIEMDLALVKERLLAAVIDLVKALARMKEWLLEVVLEDQLELERLDLCKSCNLSHHQHKMHHSD